MVLQGRRASAGRSVRGLVLGGNTIRAAGNNGIQVWRGEAGDDGTLVEGNRIEDTDYIPRLCWVGDTSRGFVLIELTQALNLSGANFTFTDKGEGTLPFEFQAHLASGDDDGYAPFRILFFDGEGA